MDHEKKSIYEEISSGGDGKGTGKVQPENMDLLHQRLFETVCYFHDFCEEHGLRYFIDGGTLIGAVRGQDFVPWDDDLDVAMLRPDFNKLFELWDEYGDKENFSLYRTTDDFCAYAPIGLMRNNNSTWVREFEAGLTDRNLGVKIDIDPLDEIPDDKGKRRIQKLFAYPYVLYLTQRKAKLRETKIRRIGSAVGLALIKSKSLRNKILHVCAKHVQKYNGTGCKRVAINGFGYVRDKSVFDNREKVMLHGREFYAPGNYDAYLTRYYGDYMTKPPVEERIPLDEPYYFDLNTPAKEYLASKKEA